MAETYDSPQIPVAARDLQTQNRGVIRKQYAQRAFPSIGESNGGKQVEQIQSSAYWS